jgi:type III secretion system YscD/HrpQ family protein
MNDTEHNTAFFSRDSMHAMFAQHHDEPLAAENDEQIILKIFSGCHQGARIALRSGRYRIGSDQGCDLVLLNDEISAEHVQLVVEKQVCHLSPVDGDAFVNGIKVIGESADVELENVITIGGVNFGLMQPRSQWQPKAMPVLTDPTDTTEQVDETAEVAIPIWKRLRWWYACVLLPIFVLPFLLMQFAFKAHVADKQLYVDDVKRIFLELGCSEPSITIDESGFMRVVGYAHDDSQKDQLAAQLDGVKRPMHYRLFSGTAIQESCNQYLTKMGLMVKARYQDPGRVMLQGFLPKREDEELLVERCKANISGITSVQTHLWVLEKLMPSITQTLGQFELENKVSIVPTVDHLLASAKINRQQYSIWRKAVAAIHETFGDDLNIVEKMDVYDEGTTRPGIINLPISGVTLGPNPYISLKGGKICFKGAPLKGGMLLKDILSDRIVVEIQGREYHYNYNQPSENLGDFQKG